MFRNWVESIKKYKDEATRVRLEAEQRALHAKIDAQRHAAAGSFMRSSEGATIALTFRSWRDVVSDTKLNEAMAAQSEMEAQVQRAQQMQQSVVRRAVSALAGSSDKLCKQNVFRLWLRALHEGKMKK